MNAIPHIPRVTVTVRMPDERFFELHVKCAAGTITPDELDELDALSAAKEAEYDAEDER